MNVSGLKSINKKPSGKKEDLVEIFSKRFNRVYFFLDKF